MQPIICRLPSFFGNFFIKNNSKQQDDAIGIIKITGIIRANDAERIIKKIIEFSENTRVKGVLLLIDSGGGQGGTSELLFREIKALCNTKPVVALVINMCCSGAYQIAAGAHWIITPSLATVGSIGVYFMLEKHKNSRIKENKGSYEADVEYEIIHGGKFKAIHHCNSAQITDEERTLIQSNTNILYKIFAASIAKERNLLIADIAKWGEGKTFSGEQALENGLIDQIGGYSDAITKLKELIEERGTHLDAKLVFIE